MTCAVRPTRYARECTLHRRNPAHPRRAACHEVEVLDASTYRVGEPTHLMLLSPAPFDERWIGIARVFNGRLGATTVAIVGHDDAGNQYGPVSPSIEEGAVVHLNSDDAEHGYPSTGLPAGLGDGEGDWYLYPTTKSDNSGRTLEDSERISVLDNIRTADGFLTAMHHRVPAHDGAHFVEIFNPGSDTAQRSPPRVINPNDRAVMASVVAKDDVPDGAGVRFREGPEMASSSTPGGRATSAPE